MFQNFALKLLSVFFISLFITCVSAQENRKPPGDNEKDAPESAEEMHKEKHDIKARERQMKATRVYSDMDKIRAEKKKVKQFKKYGSREDYVKAKEALKHYKEHLRADRRRNRQMDVFD
jgi:septation ring formation regulator EzrA